ncbi:PfkB family carbohydrate kinase [Symmachiella dynata]|uniref:PfkB family carbohydrate kinase n=1 Tax=Symmachiella dynata TaxID=2527995 RepID=UPI0030EE735F
MSHRLEDPFEFAQTDAINLSTMILRQFGCPRSTILDLRSPTMNYDLLNTFQELDSPQLLVYGDVMLDRYTFGTAQRISPEAPVVVLNAKRRECRLGGAASVCQMARELGGRVELAGVVGNDVEAEALRQIFQQQHIAGCARSTPF